MTRQSAACYMSQSAGMINDNQELSAAGPVRGNFRLEGWWGGHTEAWRGLTAGAEHRIQCHQLMFVLLHPGYPERVARRVGRALPRQITAEQTCNTPESARKDARYYVNIKQPTATISLVLLWEWRGKELCIKNKREAQFFPFLVMYLKKCGCGPRRPLKNDKTNGIPSPNPTDINHSHLFKT